MGCSFIGKTEECITFSKLCLDLRSNKMNFVQESHWLDTSKAKSNLRVLRRAVRLRLVKRKFLG